MVAPRDFAGLDFDPLPDDNHAIDPGPIDGDFGLMTQGAVISFQTVRGPVPDGEVGPQTARSLGVTLPVN